MRSVAVAIQNLVSLFRPHCADTTTLDELDELCANHTLRYRGHDLFCRVRKKNLHSNLSGDAALKAQYDFEEVCAKTLYNLGHNPDPFDPDVPFKIVPAAFAFAGLLDIADSKITNAITVSPFRIHFS
jgi:hypothetical protein